MKDQQLNDYFLRNPAWERQLEQLRKKCRSGYENGVIKLTDASREECAAAEGLLGKPFLPPNLRYKVSEFAQAVRCSRFAVTDLADFWQRLDGEPLVTSRQQHQRRTEDIEAFFAAEQAVPHGQAAQNWLREMRERHTAGYGQLTPLIGKGSDAANWLRWVCAALDRLETAHAPESIALCSNAVSSDPHALDTVNPAGRLLLQALACWKGCEMPNHARQRLALLRSAGLRMDDISCYTVQRGLILESEPGTEHPAYAALRQRQEFCLLTVSQVESLCAAASPTSRVYLVENAMLFSTLCQTGGVRQPVLCTSGQFREASWLLLDMLAASGCELWYAGDFDPEGLGMADRLWREYPGQVRLWHMQPQDYRLARSQVAISEERLRKMEKLSCPELRLLAKQLQTEKMAGYQESLLTAYLSDLRA